MQAFTKGEGKETTQKPIKFWFNSELIQIKDQDRLGQIKTNKRR